MPPPTDNYLHIKPTGTYVAEILPVDGEDKPKDGVTLQEWPQVGKYLWYIRDRERTCTSGYYLTGLTNNGNPVPGYIFQQIGANYESPEATEAMGVIYSTFSAYGGQGVVDLGGGGSVEVQERLIGPGITDGEQALALFITICQYTGDPPPSLAASLKPEAKYTP